MSVYNNIFIGFPWAQEFIVTAMETAIPVDETIRITFRKNTMTPILVDLSEGAGIERTATGFIVRMTEAQTDLLKVGHVIGDITTNKDGVDRHLNVRVTVPVVRSTTVAD